MPAVRSHVRVFSLVAVGVAAWIVASCGGGGGGDGGAAGCTTCPPGGGGGGSVALAKIVVSPSTASVPVGQTASLSASGSNAAGGVVSGLSVTWGTSDASVATVSAGVVTAVRVGSATITASVGSIQGTAVITVTPDPSGASAIRLSNGGAAGSVADDAAITLSATVTGAGGQTLATLPAGFDVIWSSSATSTATVAGDAGGLTARVSGVRGGRAVISAALVRTGGTEVAHDSGVVTVKQTVASLALATPLADTGVVGTVLGTPIIVVAKDRFGGLDSGATLAFQATAPTGKLGSVSAATAVTDGTGQARTTLTLSTLAGRNSVAATVPAQAALPALTVGTYGKPDVAASFQLLSGHGQVGATGAILRTPVAVVVKDKYGNTIPRQSVSWRQSDPPAGQAAQGTTLTAPDGTASWNWTLGPAAGTRTFDAFVPSTAFSATATATGLIPDRIDVCSQSVCAGNGNLPWTNGGFSGKLLVFDAADTPIPNVPVDVFFDGKIVPTRIPASPRTQSLVPSAVQPLAARHFSDDPLDIRGTASGNHTLVLQTISTPVVTANFTLVVPGHDEFPACTWKPRATTGLTIPTNGTDPTLTVKVNQTIQLLYDPVSCGTMQNSDVQFSLTGVAPFAVDAQRVGVVDAPITMTFKGLGVGSGKVSMVVQYEVRQANSLFFPTSRNLGLSVIVTP